MASYTVKAGIGMLVCTSNIVDHCRVSLHELIPYDKLDGPIFDRITDLRQWILPGLPDERLVIRTPLEPRDGKNIRLFVGPESTYFVFDKDREDFSTNIQDREFRAWLKGNTKPPAEEGGVRTFWPRCAPHSVALGPRDIFCVISTEGYKTSKAFKTAFPGIERYLEFAREAKILDKVVSIQGIETKPSHFGCQTWTDYHTPRI